MDRKDQNQQSYPNLVGVETKISWPIKDLYDRTFRLLGELEAIRKRNVVDPQQAEAAFGSKNQAKQLSAKGSDPLNVTNLVGRLAQPQLAWVPYFTTVPSITDPYSQDGALASVLDVLYRFYAPTEPGEWRPQGAMAVFISDSITNFTMANYNPDDYPLGSVFWINDWGNVLYIVKEVGGNKQWTYFSGTFVEDLANIPTTAFDGAVLGTNDTNLLFTAQDYYRTWRWTGSVWTRNYGEDPGDGTNRMVIKVSGTISMPGWIAVGGSPVTVTNDNATTTTVTIDPQTGFLRAGGYTGALVPATSPTWDPSAVTDTGSANIGNNSASQDVQSGTGQLVAAEPHTHTDAGHTHGLSDANAILNPPSDADGGLPDHFSFNLYIRQ